MVLPWIDRINSAIKYSFYALFFVTPLAMWPDTYELFEFNKMWIVFILSIFIFFLWAAKSILSGKLEIRKTPLDIALALFLISQIISTIFSIDPHVSLWGYYSRFNGGLFSIIAYIFLYYAFASNLTFGSARKYESTSNHETTLSYEILIVSLISGFVVALWGIPSHFGYDLTCQVFRGELNTKCWTDAFQPTIRIFSTLGQPNWMGTFMATLIPISLGFGIFNLKEGNNKLVAGFLSLSLVFYIALLWTRSQSSFVGLGIGLLAFFGLLVIKNAHELQTKLLRSSLGKYLVASILILGIITFFVGSPIESLNKYTTLSGISKIISKSQPKTSSPPAKNASTESLGSSTNIQLGGTESSKIRLIVWEGAIELFRRNPIFGTGVETFAYAYYNVKPLAHNLTSEWDYLYNKAHNEYLNFLATTGAFGLLSYLSVLVLFLLYAVKTVFHDKTHHAAILLGIVSAYLAIAVSNFFGFSVVVLNLFLFMFPIFFFDIKNDKSIAKTYSLSFLEKVEGKISPGRLSIIIGVALVALYLELYLVNFWNADRKYALGYGLNKSGQYVQAYTSLGDASKMLPSEDLYKDELSINMATLSILLSDQKQTDKAVQFAAEAMRLSTEITNRHPKNVIFLKTRARVAFALAQTDPKYLDLAIETVNKARKLAPTDAKLVYSLALFYNQKGDTKKTIENFQEALKLKPNYLDAYYAMALLYSQLAKDNPSDAAAYKQKARESAEYILKNIDPTHAPSKELLKTL